MIINNKSIEAIELRKISRDSWKRLALSEIIPCTDFGRGDVMQQPPISRSHLGYWAYWIYIHEWSDHYGYVFSRVGPGDYWGKCQGPENSRWEKKTEVVGSSGAGSQRCKFSLQPGTVIHGIKSQVQALYQENFTGTRVHSFICCSLFCILCYLFLHHIYCVFEYFLLNCNL